LFKNGDVKGWELTMWKWDGMGMQKAIPDLLYWEYVRMRMGISSLEWEWTGWQRCKSFPHTCNLYHTSVTW